MTEHFFGEFESALAFCRMLSAKSLLEIPTNPSYRPLMGFSSAIFTPCSQIRSMRCPCSL
uniref:Uncharacterized protein n=1 Tax=Anguilla anguilla TaxID=7936 RepID=A0A0E9V295_ANGAN